jgi:uncharacterized protein YndB with AHSA1/START domain
MQVIETFHTATSAEAVWRVLADLEHWKDWTPTILDISPLGEKDIRVGAQYRVMQPGLKPAVYEVTACIPNEGFTWIQKMPGGGVIASHTIRARNGLTEVELSFFSKGLVATATATLFSSKIRQFVVTEARGLKEKCETITS